jgi:predicted aspartyl protease
MIRGHVSTTLEPVIELGLVQGDTVTVIPAIIDTGFSGMLCLAERYVAQLDVTFQFLEPYELANGDIVGQEVFAGRIVLDGQEQEVEVLMTASQDTLIGAALLQPYTLTIDYPDHAVRLTKNRRKKQHIT